MRLNDKPTPHSQSRLGLSKTWQFSLDFDRQRVQKNFHETTVPENRRPAFPSVFVTLGPNFTAIPEFIETVNRGLRECRGFFESAAKAFPSDPWIQYGIFAATAINMLSMVAVRTFMVGQGYDAWVTAWHYTEKHFGSYCYNGECGIATQTTPFLVTCYEPTDTELAAITDIYSAPLPLLARTLARELAAI